MDEKVESKGNLCVTGASGYIASWLIKRLLLSGYHVIGTVRDPGNEKKVGHLWRLEGAKERLQLMRADLMEEGSFDHPIMGCHGVFHTASPVVRPLSDPKTEMVIPAIEGTLNVLRSCHKNPFLRRVVLTSSSSAVRIRADLNPNTPIDESSWSNEDLCEKLQSWYALSKTLAEKEAWKFCNNNGIELVTVIPTFVIGPSLPTELSVTASDVLSFIKGETKNFEAYGRMGYVHIDDVATCHILVYECEEARGRLLCSSAVVDNNELASLLSTGYPFFPIPKRFEKLDRPYYDFNTAKLRNLGFKFKTINEMFDECIASLVQQGHLSFPK